MALPLYLAMTAAEMKGCHVLPPQFAYMACHFSPYGTGLSNCPEVLPEGSLLIVNDRTPIHGHDHSLITAQLQEMAAAWGISGVLLDFQWRGCEETAALTKHLVDVLPCPVGVSEPYAAHFDCPIFLPPAPLDTPMEDYLHPWQSREIWLEAALDGLELILTESGVQSTPLPFPSLSPDSHLDPQLHCHYHIDADTSRARFTLYRTREDIEKMLDEATHFGVTQAVGLFQEFNGLLRRNATELHPME